MAAGARPPLPSAAPTAGHSTRDVRKAIQSTPPRGALYPPLLVQVNHADRWTYRARRLDAMRQHAASVFLPAPPGACRGFS